MAAVLDANTHYSVPVDRYDGVDNVEERMFVYVIALRTHQEQPKLMVQPNQPRCHLRANIQHFDVWKPGSRNPIDEVCVMPECDPVWVDVLDIAPFERMRSSLVRWKDAPSDRRGCFDLSEPTSVVPTMALTDDTCPVLSVCAHLHALGWRPFTGGVFVHNTAEDKRFDGSNPRARKHYFQCLLRLPEILARNAGVTSGQPQAYYKLLLLDQVVVPDMGHNDYFGRLRVLRGDPLPRLSLTAPLAIEEDEDMGISGHISTPNLPIDDGDDDDIDVSGAIQRMVANADSVPVPAAKRSTAPWPLGVPRLLAIADHDRASPSSSSSSSVRITRVYLKTETGGRGLI